MSVGLAEGKKSDRKTKQKGRKGKRGGWRIIVALAAICLVAAAGFGVWKYTDSKKILLLSKETHIFMDGTKQKHFYTYSKIHKTSNGQIQIAGKYKLNGLDYPIELVYNKDKKIIEKVVTGYGEDQTVTTYSYDKKGRLMKEKIKGESSEDMMYEYDKYGVPKGEKLKYTKKDLFGRPKKAISGKKGSGHKEYTFKNGRLIEIIGYNADGKVSLETKYDTAGNRIETTVYNDKGEVVQGYKAEYKKYKIK